MNGHERIAKERLRQLNSERWTLDHDMNHDEGQLVEAAIAYAMSAIKMRSVGYEHWWPWDAAYWKPSNQVRDLEKAGALIAAEIDRIRSL